MSERRTPKLTGEQQNVLAKAREAIRSQPESYNQTRYGSGAAECGGPVCIAGHIVAGDAKLRSQLTKRLSKARLGDREEVAGPAILEIAAETLGTRPNARLFLSAWPNHWRKNVDMPDDPRARTGDGIFVPTWWEAIQVLDGVMDGRIDDALSQRQMA